MAGEKSAIIAVACTGFETVSVETFKRNNYKTEIYSFFYVRNVHLVYAFYFNQQYTIYIVLF